MSTAAKPPPSKLSTLFTKPPPRRPPPRPPPPPPPPPPIPTHKPHRSARHLAALINHSTTPSLPPLSSLSTTSLLQTLRRISSPSKTLQFLHRLPSPLPPHSLFLVVDRLGRSRHLNAARSLVYNHHHILGHRADKLFNSLIRNYGRAGLMDEAIRVYKGMRGMGVAPSVVTYNSLLGVVLGRGKVGMALEVFEEMVGVYGVEPDACTMNVMIRGFCREGRVEEGVRVFREMRRRFRVGADLMSWNTVVDGLCRVGRMGMARELVEEMVGKGIEPNVVTYTALIRGYCVNRDVEGALRVFKEIKDRGIEPNKITYNTLVQGLCEARRFDKVKEIFEGGIDHGDFVPDTCTFNTLMIAHCNMGKFEEAMSVYRKLEELQVQPDSASYSILIRALCEKGEFERAEELFDELAKKEIVLCAKGSVPLSAAYNPMFQYLCANGKTKKAEIVFRQLLKRGTQDPPAFITLIMGHCREGTFAAGQRLLVLMLRRNFLPDYGTYLSLVEGLLRKGDPILSHRTLGMMLRSSYTPEASTFHSLLSGLLKMGHACESAELMIEMLGRKIRQNLNLSTQTILLLFKDGMRSKAVKLLSMIYDCGYLVRMEKVINYLCDSKKLHDAYQTLMFCLKKHGSIDIHICEAVITGLCNGHLISEAFSLYYELVEKGVKQLNGLETLVACLESVGKFKESEFVSKRMLDPGSLGRTPPLNLQNRREAKICFV